MLACGELVDELECELAGFQTVGAFNPVVGVEVAANGGHMSSVMSDQIAKSSPLMLMRLYLIVALHRPHRHDRSAKS